jgi:hypothetical protein
VFDEGLDSAPECALIDELQRRIDEFHLVEEAALEKTQLCVLHRAATDEKVVCNHLPVFGCELPDAMPSALAAAKPAIRSCRLDTRSHFGNLVQIAHRHRSVSFDFMCFQNL